MQNDLLNASLLDDSVKDNFSEFRLFKIGNINIGKPTAKQKTKDEAKAEKKAGKAEVKASCGKKPLFAGKRRTAWNDCVAGLGASADDSTLETETPSEASVADATEKSNPASDTKNTLDAGVGSGAGSGDSSGMSTATIAMIAVGSLLLIGGSIWAYKHFNK